MSEVPSVPWVTYNFALLRVVPHVHIGAFAPLGVVLHARTAEFLGIRVITDVAELATRAIGVDIALLLRYLQSCQAICDGDLSAE